MLSLARTLPDSATAVYWKQIAYFATYKLFAFTQASFLDINMDVYAWVQVALACLVDTVLYFLCIYVINELGQYSLPKRKQVCAGDYLRTMTPVLFFGRPLLCAIAAFRAVRALMSLCVVVARRALLTTFDITTRVCLLAKAAIWIGFKRTALRIYSFVISAKDIPQQLAGLVHQFTSSAVACIITVPFTLIRSADLTKDAQRQWKQALG
jgi:hypothetical protein